MTSTKKALTLLASGACVAAAALPASASADPIQPGDQALTAGSQCTLNFAFTGGGKTYMGYAAHCAGTGEATETNGCQAGSQPLGTPVEIEGATKPGKLAYSSWITMQRNNETDADACAYNDFALVEIDPADAANVSPTVPTFGGPTGIGGATSTGQQVRSVGNSSLRFGVGPLKPKYGVSLGTEGNGWTHTVYTATPGIPGDSGSGFLTTDGKAFGVLSTLALAPLPASNGVSDLGKALDYARANGTTVSLLNG